MIEQIHEVFSRYSIIKYNEFILQPRDYNKYVNIDVNEKPRIYIGTSNGKYRIQLSNKMYEEFWNKNCSRK